MSDLVLLHHNQPMTTSLAIAACTENEHASVILLIRKYIDELEKFGDVNFQTAKPGISRFEIDTRVFEIENCRSDQGRKTEFAFLNEPQATLLITFMRNSEIVVKFKVALVKAFFEMRDRLATPTPTFAPMNHGADVLVAADRTFRAVLRTGRSLGLRLPQVLARANAVTVARTGVDLLAEIGVTPDDCAPPVVPAAPMVEDPLAATVRDWLNGPAASLNEVTMAQIVEGIGAGSAARRDHPVETRIGYILGRLGWTKIERRNDPVRFRYRRPQ